MPESNTPSDQTSSREATHTTDDLRYAKDDSAHKQISDSSLRTNKDLDDNEIRTPTNEKLVTDQQSSSENTHGEHASESNIKDEKIGKEYRSSETNTGSKSEKTPTDSNQEKLDEVVDDSLWNETYSTSDLPLSLSFNQLLFEFPPSFLSSTENSFEPIHHNLFFGSASDIRFAALFIHLSLREKKTCRIIDLTRNENNEIFTDDHANHQTFEQLLKEEESRFSADVVLINLGEYQSDASTLNVLGLSYLYEATELPSTVFILTHNPTAFAQEAGANAISIDYQEASILQNLVNFLQLEGNSSQIITLSQQLEANLWSSGTDSPTSFNSILELILYNPEQYNEEFEELRLHSSRNTLPPKWGEFFKSHIFSFSIPHSAAIFLACVFKDISMRDFELLYPILAQALLDEQPEPGENDPQINVRLSDQLMDECHLISMTKPSQGTIVKLSNDTQIRHLVHRTLRETARVAYRKLTAVILSQTHLLLSSQTCLQGLACLIAESIVSNGDDSSSSATLLQKTLYLPQHDKHVRSCSSAEYNKARLTVLRIIIGQMAQPNSAKTLGHNSESIESDAAIQLFEHLLNIAHSDQQTHKKVWKDIFDITHTGSSSFFNMHFHRLLRRAMLKEERECALQAFYSSKQPGIQNWLLMTEQLIEILTDNDSHAVNKAAAFYMLDIIFYWQISRVGGRRKKTEPEIRCQKSLLSLSGKQRAALRHSLCSYLRGDYGIGSESTPVTILRESYRVLGSVENLEPRIAHEIRDRHFKSLLVACGYPPRKAFLKSIPSYGDKRLDIPAGFFILHNELWNPSENTIYTEKTLEKISQQFWFIPIFLLICSHEPSQSHGEFLNDEATLELLLAGGSGSKIKSTIKSVLSELAYDLSWFRDELRSHVGTDKESRAEIKQTVNLHRMILKNFAKSLK